MFDDNFDENTVVDEVSSDASLRELEELTKKNVELNTQVARLLADIANMQRRVEKDKISWYELAKSEVIAKLLPFLDEMLLALDAYKKIENLNEQVVSGLILIVQNFDKSLKQLGVAEIESENFDPELHEAIGFIAVEGKLSGAIVEVVRKGFVLNKKVIRCAQVVVAK